MSSKRIDPQHLRRRKRKTRTVDEPDPVRRTSSGSVSYEPSRAARDGAGFYMSLVAAATFLAAASGDDG